MTDKNIDPELVDDRDTQDEDVVGEIELPEYDPSQFELPDDYEYSDEDGDDDADNDEE